MPEQGNSISQRKSKVQEEILSKLSAPKTLQEIADALGMGYHGTRRYVTDMLNQGLIEESGILRNRAKVYVKKGVNPENAHENSIPRLHNYVDGNDYKAISIATLVGYEDDMAATKVVKATPGIVAQLMYIAMLCNKGLIQTEELRELRNELQRNYVVLNNTMQIIKQLLEIPDFWDQQRLKFMPLDKDFDIRLVRTAYEQVKGETIL